ncbi:MAG: kinase/pyrophosphorylase [Rhodospirillaceae bacterium]|nr:kinase/pyrophosphorylase [Rhodospirillaceae bacterium]
MVSKHFHLHLVSDATGETVNLVARASLVQFENIDHTEHVWNMVRNESQIREIIDGVKENPGFVLYTLVDSEMRSLLENSCRELKVPCIPILDPVVNAMGSYLKAEIQAAPGRQHVMDAEYFSKIEALHFVLSHDDGQSTRSLNTADVIIVGVSRTSKTPTCIYLANRGLKAANVPIVPGCQLPPELMKANKPLIVRLTNDPRQLVQIRRNRLKSLGQDEATDYIDLETVTSEVKEARRLFASQNWPMIDVTRKSVEEVAANILQLYNRRLEQHS